MRVYLCPLLELGVTVLCCVRSLFFLCARGEQFQQHGVPFVLEFFNRARAGLLQYSVDDRLLDLGTEVGDFPQVLPPSGDWAGEVLHEMLDSAGPATEMKQKIGPHYSPTQPRSPAHGGVRISDVQYTLLDEIHDLAIQSGLESIRDVADNFFSDMDRLLANRGIKRDRALDGFRCCLCACHNLDQGDHMRRIERVGRSRSAQDACSLTASRSWSARTNSRR